MKAVISTAAGARLWVHVQPRARCTEVAGRHGDAIKVRLQAPPVEGAANEALVRFLAERLEVPRAAVVIVAGQSSRRKMVDVRGVTARAVEAALGLAPPTRPVK